MTGVLVGFATEQALRRALDRLAAAHVVDGIETYTPISLNEGPTGSPLPLLMFLAGILGFAGFFLVMAYADVRAFPLDIGGRPDFSWPSFAPIAFELGVLCAMTAGFVGYFVVCRMPRPYDPVDECVGFRRASIDGWFVAIHSADVQLVANVHAVLDGLMPMSVEEFSS